MQATKMSLSKLFPCFKYRLNDNINRLDYSNTVLSEGFPHVWEYERTLEELNVTSTRIQYLPPQLFYCQGLKVLLANNNNLETIPEAIGSLRQLQELNISRNFISNVPDNIKSCKNLVHLDLSCNTLQKLPDAITCLISLQELILNETYLEFLPANFGRLVNLRLVELRSNNLISLPKSMQRLVNLQRLDIGCNEFKKMPEVIGELRQLRELWFDFNQIESLPLSIGKLRNLIHCEANGNCLNIMPNEIGNWRNLEILSLSLNNLPSLPFSFGMIKSLVTLKCEANELTELPCSISNLENLEELVISHNKLKSLPNTIGLLRKLRYLFADDNNIQRLPDEICSCSELSVLSISRNKLIALPDNIGHLTHLKVLNIVQNNIETLPVTVLSLVNLTSLWISNNQSQPLIPLQYADLSNKTQLTCFMLPQSASRRKDAQLNNLNSQEANSGVQKSNKAAGCINSKRRICFSEETTILHSDPSVEQSSIVTSSKIYNNSNSILNVSSDNTTISKRKKNVHNCNGIVNESPNPIIPIDSKDFLMRSPTPYPKELRLMAKYVQVNQGKLSIDCINERNISHEENGYQYPSTSLTQGNGNEIQDCENYNCNKFVEHQQDMSNEDISQNSRYSSLQRQVLQTKQHIQIPNEHDNQQMVAACNTQKPPPYHIARCFTKKSVEDLTKYEFARNRQIQQNYQNCNTNNDQMWSNTDLNNVSMPKSEFPIDNQNSLPINLENELIDKNKNTSNITESNTKYLENLNSPETNVFTNTKSHNKQKKWLFGAHKNPRVLQVTINWENGRDFEIDVLPNNEGIFIVSATSDSHAFQLVRPLDKLLEVDGVDFTNITKTDALKVLDSSRPSISIMLSRK